MKKIAIAALTFLLAATAMVACRADETQPSTTTGAPTTVSTAPTTMATTAPTTTSTAPSTKPSDGGMLENGKIDGKGDAGRKGAFRN